MAYPFAFSTMRAAALALLCAGLSACTTVLLPPNVVHVAPLSHSVEQANRSLELAAQERAAIEARFAASEQVCYTRFFVNSCLDAAKEKRRSGLAAVRAVEIEAEYYKRKADADARDKALAEALKEDEAKAAQRAAEPKPVREEPPAAPPKPMSAKVNREAANAAKLKRIAEKEQAEAGKRAANVEKFERKKRESEQRQREIAAKKAEKAAKGE